MRPILAALAFCLAANAQSDWHSFADPSQARIVHSHFDLRADFDRRVLEGAVTHRLSRPATTLTLDTRALAIQSARCGNAPAQFTLGANDEIRGRELRIQFSKPCKSVRIQYATHPNASGLRWLNPEQTAGRKLPFLASQSWSIHARSWAPLQDSPQNKFTYTASVRVPPGMLALMSAENPIRPSSDGRYSFRQRKPIPPHLLALAAGNLQFAPLGPRTGVYADPVKLSSARAEFSSVGKMLQAAQQIAGPYLWNRFDILLLPPGAPFGGMENPRLTFLSDTILAGDGIQVSTVAHELAHAWSGNQVSNATWDDIWISEGFTTYLTFRIQQQVYGLRRAAAAYHLALRRLQHRLETLDPSDQRVHRPSAGRHPDSLLGPIPYFKASLIFHAAEHHAGRNALDRWLKTFFRRHRWQSLTTAAVQREFTLLPAAQLDQWLEQPGLPSIPRVSYESAWTAALENLRAGRTDSLDNWHSEEVELLLGDLESDPGRLQPAPLHASLARFQNRDLRAAWLQVAIAAAYLPAQPEIEKFSSTASRRELERLFTALVNLPAWRPLAGKILEENSPRLGESATNALRSVLQ
jgi:leukotriene-A4 hydrolase